ncbi:hypothetical protein Tco_0163537 [Tanacetum coccineum]
MLHPPLLTGAPSRCSIPLSCLLITREKMRVISFEEIFSNVLISNIQELEYIENIVSNNESYDELKGNNDVISYTDYMLTIGNDKNNYVPPPIQKNDIMLFVIEQMKSHVEKCNKIYENYKLRAQLKGKFSEYGTSMNTKLSKPSTSITKLYSVTLFLKSKLIPKVVEKNDLSKSANSHLTTNKTIEKCTEVLAPGLRKIDFEPNKAYFKNNRVVHRDYLKVTKDRVATLPEFLEEARALKPLDEHIGRVSSINASGSKSRSNTKNNSILQPSSKSMKNKVEAHHWKFKSSANKNNHFSDCNANVKNVALSKNSNTICLSSNV